jgi:hypothetical protein
VAFPVELFSTKEKSIVSLLFTSSISDCLLVPLNSYPSIVSPPSPTFIMNLSFPVLPNKLSIPFAPSIISFPPRPQIVLL